MTDRRVTVTHSSGTSVGADVETEPAWKSGALLGKPLRKKASHHTSFWGRGDTQGQLKVTWLCTVQGRAQRPPLAGSPAGQTLGCNMGKAESLADPQHGVPAPLCHPGKRWGSAGPKKGRKKNLRQLSPQQDSKGSSASSCVPRWLRNLGSEWMSLEDCGKVLEAGMRPPFSHPALLGWKRNAIWPTEQQEPGARWSGLGWGVEVRASPWRRETP